MSAESIVCNTSLILVAHCLKMVVGLRALHTDKKFENSWGRSHAVLCLLSFFFFQAEDGIRDVAVTGVQTCALPIFRERHARGEGGREGAAERARLERARRGSLLRGARCHARAGPVARRRRDRLGSTDRKSVV